MSKIENGSEKGTIIQREPEKIKVSLRAFFHIKEQYLKLFNTVHTAKIKEQLIFYWSDKGQNIRNKKYTLDMTDPTTAFQWIHIFPYNNSEIRTPALASNSTPN